MSNPYEKFRGVSRQAIIESHRGTDEKLAEANERIKALEAELDAIWNKAIERADEIATGMMDEYASPSWDDACENIAEAIRKELK